MTPSAVAYWNGRTMAAAEVAIPVYDRGFLLGTTVAEQLRTFGGRLFRLEEHLQRLARSLEIVGVRLPESLPQIAAAAEQVAAHNHRLLDPADDLALVILATPGPSAAMAPAGAEQRPTLCLHSYCLPFHLWADKYDHGERLATTDVAQVPGDCWPPQLKCRSRMHYYRADRAAAERFPGARALMTDSRGSLTEATTANLLVYRADAGLLTPPRDVVLPGISLAAVERLAAGLQLPLVPTPLAASDLAGADEAILCSTSPCLLPVVEFQGRAIGTGRPGPVFARLLEAWGKEVGVDIAAQARRFAQRRPA